MSWLKHEFNMAPEPRGLQLNKPRREGDVEIYCPPLSINLNFWMSWLEHEFNAFCREHKNNCSASRVIGGGLSTIVIGAAVAK